MQPHTERFPSREKIIAGEAIVLMKSQKSNSLAIQQAESICASSVRVALANLTHASQTQSSNISPN